ncbi:MULTISPECIES: DUF4197 domain-containing protein [unclassified Siphonobacter]|uniref:DUF4197 domain-containing protein n=1 Tax=unclassified Siphonobacter TaxID=2635712 RepID=UPI00278624BD|nr:MULTISPECIES: DUF4197 domain-containing protein [unclassified Siphonobacter]MDQ1088952.1 hypothetical protein [Siphonobacter sp. SORGH_AS_1065]MDR6195133.1 hypothetical protein [Siphonobacter sp. SORGH_AS_0500]
MKSVKTWVGSLLVLGLTTQIVQAQTDTTQAAPKKSGWGGILQKAGTILNQSSSATGLGSDEIAKGLKEALTVGIRNGSDQASKTDGFFKNSLIKILLPPEIQKAESTLRRIGLGKQVDQFVLTLNRGAEDASKKAFPIFVDAITKMTIPDAINILKGEKNAATEYLKRTSFDALYKEFSPVIQTSIEKTQATKYYGTIVTSYNKLPLVPQKLNPDLNDYATRKAIDGLFKLVEQEEAKIRENPQARVTDLLKKVFGQQ